MILDLPNHKQLKGPFANRLPIHSLTRRRESDIIEVSGMAREHNAEARIVQEWIVELRELQFENE